MKEFVSELVDKVAELAEGLGKKTEPFVKKTEEMVEIQKVKSQIRTLKGNNSKDFSDLGAIVYSKFQKELIEDEELIAICEEVEQRNEAIEELEMQVTKLQGKTVCPECESSIYKKTSFCPNCGAPIITDDEEGDTASEEVVDEQYFEEGDIVETVETEDDEIEIELVVEEIEK